MTFFLILLIFLPLRLQNIDQPLRNITSFRQAQTATVALNFYKHGLNFFRSELDIFGIGREKYLTLEFPLYQAIVALLYRLFFVHDLWGRAVSVVSGFIAAYALYKSVFLLSRSHHLSVLSAFFFLAVPLNMFHQRDFLIEPTVIAGLMSAFYFYLQWVTTNQNKYWLFAVLLFSLSFVQKIMYGPFLFIPLVMFYIRKNKLKSVFRWKFILSLIIPIAFYLIWQKQADMLNISHNQTYFTSSNFRHLEWNFGLLADRLSASLWQFRMNNFLNGIFLKPGLMLFLIGIISFYRYPGWRFFYIWLFSEILYFLVFFRIQSHIYYQMIISPITSVFLAAGLAKMANLKIHKILNNLLISLIAAFFLWRSIISSDWDASLDLAWYNRLMTVGKAVSNQKYGLLVNPGYDWNSVYTYYPRLKLLTLSSENFTEPNLNKWKNQGYSYVILHRYREFPAALPEFLNSYKNILQLEDFKVYLLHEKSTL